MMIPTAECVGMVWFGVGLLVAAIVAICIAALAIRYYAEKYQLMVSNGYEQASLPGLQGPQWVKSRHKDSP